jgi:hypothetical protein
MARAVHCRAGSVARHQPTERKMKTNSSLVIGLGIATLAVCTPFAAPAKTKPTPSPAAEASPAASPMEKSMAAKKPRSIPFHGKIASVDASAKTFSIAGKEKTRVIKITDETKITKQGAAATMTDLAADEEVRGSYWKKDDGSLEARSVKLGPLTAEEMAKHEARMKKKSEAAPAASPTASP